MPQTWLRDYELLDEIGKGAFASVYKVRHKSLEYIRAVRVLNQHIVKGEQDILWQKFIQECKVLLRLGNGNHPNIVKIFQPLLREDKAFVEMDYISGMDLRQYIESQNYCVKADEVIRFAREIASALSYCHHDIYLYCMDREYDNLQDDPDDGSRVLITPETEKRLVKKYQVIHNDLHTGNVMRRISGSYVLLDFGLAIQDQDVLHSSQVRGGAPEYKSPEKWNNENVITTQSDIFSFGIILYEMLTGTVPFKYDSSKPQTAAEYMLMQNILHDEIPSAFEQRKKAFEKAYPGRSYQRDYPEWLEQIIKRCLEKKPEDRFTSGKELYTAIEKGIEGEKTATPRAEIITQESPTPQQVDIAKYVYDEDTPIRQVKADAAAGNAAAQALLAEYYAYGMNKVKVSKNDEFEWARMSADQGNPFGQYRLAHFYADGDVIGEDEDKAEELRKAALPLLKVMAEKGIARAQNDLGYCCLWGYLVEMDDDEAVKWFRKAAEQGYARAQYNLGYCYRNGYGVEQNYSEAVKWYRKAAEQGYASAQYNLGVCYKNGKGVSQNYSEAVKWYRKAAEQGDEYAQNKLGDCYYYGFGVSQNYSEAVKWYRKAAEQGHAHAQSYLGDCYYNGEGVEQNYSEAVKWYRKVAEQGYASAQFNLGVCYYYGKGVEQNYSEAVKWYRKAAEQGNAYAQNNLGVCYKDGDGVSQNYNEAAKWYRKAAEQGNASAQSSLGYCYEKGYGVEQNYSEAVKWYRKAAEQGNAYAQNNLGECYYYGYGVKQNYSEAVKWFRKAAEQGNADAQCNLGYCYESGNGVEQNYSEAVKWYRKAAEQGQARAQCNLGYFYDSGNGVEQNYSEAVKWFRKAAEQGNADAQCNLVYCYKNGYGVAKDKDEV